jgi:hypothetical protein
MLNTSCTQVYIKILKNNKCNENMILLHDTTHYKDSIIHEYHMHEYHMHDTSI